MSIKRKRKRRKKRRRIFLVIAGILAAAAVAVLVIWKGFVVKTVTVVGNEIYSDAQIKDWALDDEYSWNSLYVVFKHKLEKQEEIPFVDSMEITLKSPTEIQITVEEKAILGYLYISGLGQNAYFDQDGFVVELSSDVIEGAVKISGLTVESAELYEKLEFEDSDILDTLLTLTESLEAYGRTPEVILIQDDNTILLSFGDIQVNLGDAGNLEEKILRMDQILEELSGQSGTLHMELWTDSDSDVWFKQGELTEIPADIQTVPTDTDSSADTAEESGEDTEAEDAAEESDEDTEAEDTGVENGEDTEADAEDAGEDKET